MHSILRKSLAVSVLILAISLATTTTLAKGGGIIVITPQWPIAQKTPATLEISVNSKPADPTYDPQILLVMTVACWEGLTSVEVEWTDYTTGLPHVETFDKGDFSLLAGTPPPKIPPSTISDVQYTRSALADHLYEPGDAPVRYIMFPLVNLPPDGKLHTTPQTLKVTLDSTDPKMLVYAIGRSSPSAKFDRWVPPTNPGFVVPELGTILLAAASFSALALYALKRGKCSP